MTEEFAQQVRLSDDEFSELEEMLVSDDVPADCMNLEMLDGYLAAVIAGPVVQAPADWLAAVWSADADEASFGSASAARSALAMVLRYHNEIAATIALGEDGWDPFCYSPEGKDAPPLGDEWIAGFEQGLETWPADWRERLTEDDAEIADGLIERAFAPWASDEEEGDLEVRLGWLAESAQAVRGLYAHWRELGLPAPLPVSVDAPGTSQSGGPGRNDPCPCGSGKKYKKCCGASV